MWWCWRWRQRFRDARPVGIRCSLTGSCRRCRHYRYHYVEHAAAAAAAAGRSVGRPAYRFVRSVGRLIAWAISCCCVRSAAFSILSARASSRACGAICRRYDDDDDNNIAMMTAVVTHTTTAMTTVAARTRPGSLPLPPPLPHLSLSYVVRAKRRPHTRELSRVHVRHTLRVLRSATLGRGQRRSVFLFFF